ncbi:MAG: glycogen/starch/alpha-glucan phosphorylase, partial [Cyanobacteriota bacterium]
DLVRRELLADFARLKPELFTNVTNGVTPRRWVALANPALNELMLETIGPDWPAREVEWLRLEALQADPAFLARWEASKLEAKRRLAALIAERTGQLVDPTSLFDVQVKRIHEYKRQHLNALHLVVQYLRIKQGDTTGMVPRSVLFGGKAAPGYYMAKLIIRFINGIAEVINNDPDCKSLLKVIFMPDYNVKIGEKVYPAADLSEQISTAGKEASGTGNMKFAMNGALTIGTLDGANVEIREQVGAENFFLFGHTAAEIVELAKAGYCPWELIPGQQELAEALRLIEQGHFSNGDQELFRPLLQNLTGSDPFFVLADFADYLRAQGEVSQAWADPTRWNRMSLLNSARTGFFSSDRSIRQYAKDIWRAEAFPVTITCELD